MHTYMKSDYLNLNLPVGKQVQNQWMGVGPLGGINLYINQLVLRKEESILRYAIVLLCAFSLVPSAICKESKSLLHLR